MPFAQLVLGSPGSGKSTYCNGMQQFMSAIGRKCSVVNLDPANDQTSYPCAIDVRDLIKLEDIMEEDSLGPNGGVLYALEELEQNMEWLEEGLSELGEDYVLFDCPGQVELYTHHSSLRNIFFKLQKLGYRVRISITSDNPMDVFADFGAACSSTPFRFLLLDSPFAIYFESHPLVAGDATDGLTASQRTDENRQTFFVCTASFQSRFLHRSAGSLIPPTFPRGRIIGNEGIEI